MADGNPNQKSGYLDIKQSSKVKGRKLKAWRKRWVVVTKLTDLAKGTHTAKIDVYSSDPASHQGQGRTDDRVTFILDCVTAVQLASSKTHPFAFEIVEREAVLVLSGSSELESFNWMSALRHIFFTDLGDMDTECFAISIQPNDDSKRLKLSGHYTLRISPEGVALMAPAKQRKISQHSYSGQPLTTQPFGNAEQDDVDGDLGREFGRQISRHSDTSSAGEGSEGKGQVPDELEEVIIWKLSMLKRFNVDKSAAHRQHPVFMLDCGPNSPTGEASLRLMTREANNILTSIRRCINIAMATRRRAQQSTSDPRNRTESTLTVSGYQALLDGSLHHEMDTASDDGWDELRRQYRSSRRSRSSSSMSTMTPVSPTSSAADGEEAGGVAIPARSSRVSVTSMAGSFSSSPGRSNEVVFVAGGGDSRPQLVLYGQDQAKVLQQQQQQHIQVQQQVQQQQHGQHQQQVYQQQQQQQQQQFQEWIQQQPFPMDPTQQMMQFQQWNQQADNPQEQQQQLQLWTIQQQQYQQQLLQQQQQQYLQQQQQQPDPQQLLQHKQVLQVQELMKDKGGIIRNFSEPNVVTKSTEDIGYDKISNDCVRMRTSSMTTKGIRGSESVCSGDSGVVVSEGASIRKGSNSFDSQVSTESSVSTRKISDATEPFSESPPLTMRQIFSEPSPTSPPKLPHLHSESTPVLPPRLPQSHSEHSLPPPPSLPRLRSEHAPPTALPHNQSEPATQEDKQAINDSNPHIYQDLDAVWAEGYSRRRSSVGFGLERKRSHSTGDVRTENDYEEVGGLRKGVVPAVSVLVVSQQADTPPELPARPASILHGKSKTLSRRKLPSPFGFLRLSSIRDRRELELEVSAEDVTSSSKEVLTSSSREGLTSRSGSTDLYSTINDTGITSESTTKPRRFSDITRPHMTNLNVPDLSDSSPKYKPVPAPRNSSPRSSPGLPSTPERNETPDAEISDSVSLLKLSDKNDVMHSSRAVPSRTVKGLDNAKAKGVDPDSVVDSKAALMDFFLNDLTFQSNPMVTGDFFKKGEASTAADGAAEADPDLSSHFWFSSNNSSSNTNTATGWADFSSPSSFSSSSGTRGNPWAAATPTSTMEAGPLFEPASWAGTTSAGADNTRISARVEGVYIDMKRKAKPNQSRDGGSGCEYVAPGDITRDMDFFLQ